MACIVMAGDGIAFNNDSHGQILLDVTEAGFARDIIALFANDEFCRQQRAQPTAFLRIWSWPAATATFKHWISS